MKKIPLTKAGKPDKRYVAKKTAPSKATKKAPTKRLQERREKNTDKGFYPNPIKQTKPDNYIGVGYVKGKKIFAVIEHSKKIDYILAMYDDETEAKIEAIKVAMKKRIPCKVVTTRGNVEYR